MSNQKYTYVSEDVFWKLFNENPHVRVRKFQSSTGEDKFSVLRDSSGQVVDFIHDFVPIF